MYGAKIMRKHWWLQIACYDVVAGERNAYFVQWFSHVFNIMKLMVLVVYIAAIKSFL
jgi:hypothetical protein